MPAQRCAQIDRVPHRTARDEIVDALSGREERLIKKAFGGIRSWRVIVVVASAEGRRERRGGLSREDPAAGRASWQWPLCRCESASLATLRRRQRRTERDAVLIVQVRASNVRARVAQQLLAYDALNFLGVSCQGNARCASPTGSRGIAQHIPQHTGTQTGRSGARGGAGPCSTLY